MATGASVVHRQPEAVVSVQVITFPDTEDGALVNVQVIVPPPELTVADAVMLLQVLVVVTPPMAVGVDTSSPLLKLFWRPAFNTEVSVMPATTAERD